MRQILTILACIIACTCMAQERIYIQTNRNRYLPGDTVWIRAHLTDAATNIPSTSRYFPANRSRYVYVELHDAKADTLMQRIMIRRDSAGVFSNVLILPNKIRRGHYILTAYTRNMLHFPDKLFAYREIEVVADCHSY